jgi:hypothetical protein
MSMRYSSRFFLYAPFLVLIVIAIAAMLRWWVVAGVFETWLLHANGRDIAPGIRLHFASEEMGGFPFSVDTVLNGVTLEAKCARASMSWRAEHFAIHSITYGRNQKVFEAGGKQILSWTDPGGGAHRLAFASGSLRASAIFSDDALARFDLDATGFAAREISGERAQLHFRRAHERDAIDVAMSADALHLSPVLQAGIGPAISHATLVGQLVPAPSFVPLLSGHEEWCAAANRWSRNAGSFRLERFEIGWGKISAEGSGRLTLDGLHRPQGALQLSVAHAEQLIVTPASGRQLLGALSHLAHGTRSGAGAPMEISAAPGNGAVTLRADREQQAESAGSIGALY